MVPYLPDCLGGIFLTHQLLTHCGTDLCAWMQYLFGSFPGVPGWWRVFCYNWRVDIYELLLLLFKTSFSFISFHFTLRDVRRDDGIGFPSSVRFKVTHLSTWQHHKSEFSQVFCWVEIKSVIFSAFLHQHTMAWMWSRAADDKFYFDRWL